jgi:apolipoprotein D and lipocalin family protein
MPRLMVLALLLASCAKPVVQVMSFRDAATPIYSNAVMDMGGITGDWAQAASFALDGDCRAGAVRIVQSAQGLMATGHLCLGGVDTDVTGPLRVLGTGRLQTAQGAVWWVVWADTALRSLAIGTPDGRFGFILDRTGGLPADRLEAARQVFDFNGYAVAYLQIL